MKSYHFHLKAGKDLYLNMETTPQGWVIVSRFIPDYLSITYGNPFAAGNGINALEADEFEEDCMRMVYCFDDNNLNYRDSQHCFAVLNAVVGHHIKKYGRIFFSDLLTYAGEMCELMSSMGYSDATLKVLFPNFIAAVIGQNEQHIKDDAPNPFDDTPFWQRPAAPSNPRSFVGTSRYQRLVEMCPPLRSLPII